MVVSCCVPLCTNRFVKDSGVSFYRFPKELDQRTLWVRALRRKQFNLNESIRICSVHFQTGKPSKDPNHPDFIPNVFPWGRSKASAAKYEARKVRSEKRAALSSPVETSAASTSTDAASTNDASKPVTLVSISFGPIWQRKEKIRLREKLYRLKTKVKQENEEVAKLNIENLKNFSNILPVKEILQSLAKPNVDHQERCSFKSTGQCSCNMVSSTSSELLEAPCPAASQAIVTTKPTIIRMHSKGERHECKICSKSFIQPAQLIIHKQIHHNKRRYTCVICAKSFTQANSLKIHVRTHASKKPYKYNSCGRSFTQESNLNNHTIPKPYACEICKKAFAYAHQLESHRSVHYVKFYICNICNAPFSDPGAMSRHRVLVHTNVKPHRCEFCERRFAFFYQLKYHRMTHTNVKVYVCDICDKSFGHSSSRNRHRLIHTKEKLYACNVCGKEFASSSNLNQHMLTFIHRAKLNDSENEKPLLRPVLIMADKMNNKNEENC